MRGAVVPLKTAPADGVNGPGQSSVADMARLHAEHAINVLAAIMSDDNQSPAARISAATALLDRGHGRPGMAMEVTHATTLAEEFEALLGEVRRNKGD